MGYVLNAFIARKDVLEASVNLWSEARIIDLNNGFAMLPFTERLQEEIGVRTGELIFGVFYKLSCRSVSWAEALSENGPVAYIEINMFGGAGDRAAVVWENGELVYGPQMFREVERKSANSCDAVTNNAFQFLGVIGKQTSDEFEALGLGKHRDTENWLLDLAE